MDWIWKYLLILLHLCWRFSVVSSFFHKTVDYPCIGDSTILTADQVCDGHAQCRLQDDEYFCDSVSDFRIHIVETGGDFGYGGDETCCKNVLCLTLANNTNAPRGDVEVEIESIGPGFDETFRTAIAPEWKCPFHRRHYEDLKCAESLSEECPLGCSCCPLVITCNGSTWSDMLDEFNRKSRVSVRILKISNLVNASDRDWSHMAKIFPYLRYLYISNTLLKTLHAAEFSSFKNLDVLALIRDGIVRVEKNHFEGLTNLKWLAIEENNITKLDNEPFSHLQRLQVVSFLNNPLSTVGIFAWTGFQQLTYLRLDRTAMVNLTKSTFIDLGELVELYLQRAQVSRIEPGTFIGTPNLAILYLSHNNLKRLQMGSFLGPGAKLEQLDLFGNPITNIDTGAFQDLVGLRNLQLKGMQHLQLNRGMFQGLTLQNVTVETNRHGVCCLLEDDTCAVKAQAIEFNECGRLLPNPLTWFIWVMSVGAIFGNVLIIGLRYRRRDESSSQNVQRIMIVNLAISDLLMGVYMIIIGAVDVHYGHDFFWYSEEWRTEHHLCQFAGFLVLLSSETSVFIITLISIDRFIILSFPFGQKRVRGKVFHLMMALIWVVSMIISLIGAFGKNEGLYGQSNVCIGLPLVRKYLDVDGYTNYKNFDLELKLFDEVRGPAWTLSIVVFLGINFACLLIVLFCYIAIFISVQRSRQTANRDPTTSEEIKMALKMSLIVGTDFFCWMPIVILGIITQSGDSVTIPTEVYAWIIVFILPINSALNPYIYSAVEFKRRRLFGDANRSTVTFRLTKLVSSRKERGRENDGGSPNATSVTRSSTFPSPHSPRRGRVDSSPRTSRSRVDSSPRIARSSVNGNYLPVDTYEDRT